MPVSDLKLQRLKKREEKLARRVQMLNAGRAGKPKNPAAHKDYVELLAVRVAIKQIENADPRDLVAKNAVNNLAMNLMR